MKKKQNNMEYTILKRNKYTYNSKWEMAKTDGQIYKSHVDAVLVAKRLALDLPNQELMVCELQTTVTAESVKVTDLRKEVKHTPVKNSEWF